MAIIERTWTFFPGRSYTQRELSDLLPLWLEGRSLSLAERLFRRSGVATRNLALPPEDVLLSRRSFAAKNQIYRACVRDACGAIARLVAEETNEIERESIDLLVTASCTGFQIPSMDGSLVSALELSPNLRRLSLTEHGCAAGAAGLGVAHEWLASRPFARALVVCVELCSLTFMREDLDEENLVSAAIFGDGAAAVLLAGECAESSRPKPPAVLRIDDTFREIFAGTEHFMGFDVRDEGLKIKLSRDVVPFCSRFLPELFSRVLSSWSIPGPDALSIGAVHPGGRRVLEALEEHVRLPRSVTRTSWETLQSHGNMSSVTVLAALDRLLRDEPALVPGARGLLSAFGPGFCAELALLGVGEVR